jgi:hypothetical protein
VGAGGHWRSNAVVERHSDHEIAIGFAEAAHVIVASWVNRSPNDLLFEPLVFTHRNVSRRSDSSESAATLRAIEHKTPIGPNGQDNDEPKAAVIKKWC